MIKAAVLGATGYAGAELVRILSLHKDASLVWLASHSYSGKKFSDVYPMMKGRCDLVLQDDDIAKASENADVIFLALPAGLAAQFVTPELIRSKVVIDLGADFRLKDRSTYEAWYHNQAADDDLLAEAVYGLVELHRKEIKTASLIANPGCYTTCSILTLYPLVRNRLIETDTIVIDAKSGTSGAGRSSKTDNLFCEVNENIKPYGVAAHRHTPEIEQELSLAAGEDIILQFTPHLVPMNRGILATCCARLRPGVGEDEVKAAYSECYGNERFIRLCSDIVQTKNVKGTNYADISFRIDRRTGNIIAMGCIDNLVKGAAGQAVQNMNVRFGCDEAEGLDFLSVCTF